jgi:hypothetical protein
MFAPKPRYPSSEQLSRYRNAERKAKEIAREMEGVNGDLSFDLYRLAREAQAEADRIEQELTGCLAEIASARELDAWVKTASVGEIEHKLGLA